MKGIILAAGRGSRMGDMTDQKPKCLIELNGQSLIDHQLNAFKDAGIEDIALITGYKRELLSKYGSKGNVSQSGQGMLSICLILSLSLVFIN